MDTAFRGLVALLLGVGVVLASVGYFQRYRADRPAVGVFNGRDVLVMLAFVLAMPLLFLALPDWAVTVLFGAVLAGVISAGTAPVVRRVWHRRGLVGAAVGAEILLAATGNTTGLAAVNTAVVVCATVAAANLNVQGGLRLRHAAWFVLALAGYDLIFATAMPLTQRLFADASGAAFAPVAEIRVGGFAAATGMGDLLAFGLFALAAYKAYSRPGLTAALIAVALFGAVVPAIAPMLVRAITGHAPSIIATQIIFGPAAFLTYLLLRRRGEERRMAECAVHVLRAG